MEVHPEPQAQPDQPNAMMAPEDGSGPTGVSGGGEGGGGQATTSNSRPSSRESQKGDKSTRSNGSNPEETEPSPPVPSQAFHQESQLDEGGATESFKAVIPTAAIDSVEAGPSSADAEAAVTGDALMRAAHPDFQPSETQGSPSTTSPRPTAASPIRGGDEVFEETAPLITFEPDRERLNRISEMAERVRSTRVPAYLADFDTVSKEGAIVLGSITVEEAELQEQRFEEERIHAALAEAQYHQRRQEDIVDREKHARVRMHDVNVKMQKEHRKRERQRKEEHRMREAILHTAFNQAEDQLVRVLEERKGAVTRRYGKLKPANSQYGNIKGRRWKVDWTKAPQPLQIRLDLIRGLKDKAPQGRYVILVSIYDRLAANVMRWSSLQGSEWAGVTNTPLDHNGRFYDTEMKIDQSVFTVAPSKEQMKPSMALVFELFLLRGSHSHLDQVVAWGAFPLSDPKFDAIRGKYKCVLLKGEVDPTMDKYEKIEKAYLDNLDNWLCNLYFEVTHLPRYQKGEKEYEVELQFTSNLLNHPERVEDSDSNLSWEGDSSDSQSDVFASSSSDEEETNKSKRKKVLEGALVEEEKGLTYVVHEENQLDAGKGKQKKSLEQQLEKYMFGLRQPVGARAKSEGSKMAYIKRDLLADMGLTTLNWEFWGVIILIALMFWLRLYTHYLGQWLFLSSLNVPIVEFELHLHTVDLVFPQEILPLSYEVGQVLAGTMFNSLIFLAFILFVAFTETLLGCFPDNGSRVLSCFGLAVILDPVLILIVDCGVQNWEGDAFRLYNYFIAEEGSGVAGIFLTFFLVVGHLLFSGFLFYTYILNYHMNGRMLDVYNRLNSPNEHFITPSDLEVSARELSQICVRAERWRGKNGERRKIIVSEYVMTDLDDPSFRETTSHLAIYMLGVEGSRTLHRHFVRIPDGTILEVFGDLSSLAFKSTDLISTSESAEDFFNGNES